MNTIRNPTLQLYIIGVCEGCLLSRVHFISIGLDILRDLEIIKRRMRTKCGKIVTLAICTIFVLLICRELSLKINEFGCYEAKIEESKKGRQLPGVEPRTMPQSHTWKPLSMCCQNSVRD